MGLVNSRIHHTGLILIVLTGMAASSLHAGARPDFSQRRLAYAQGSQDTLTNLARLTRHYYAGVPLTRFDEDAWAMAEGFARLGLNKSAEDHYRRAAALGIRSEDQDRAWLALARSLYRRGAYTETLDALEHVSEKASAKIRDDSEFLRAQSRMLTGQYPEAAAGIKKWKSPNRRDDYTRYNLGVALLKVGDFKQGTGLLEQVGTGAESGSGEEQLALRDKANIALGFSFLRAEQGATAKPVFQRVRLEGPFSDKALLGAGWAELAPQGKPQEHISFVPIGCIDDPLLVLGGNDTFTGTLRRPARDPCDRDAVFKKRRKFTKATRRESREVRLKRALVPWMELVNRDPRRTAVQEALVAAPYVMAELGAVDQATGAYRYGIQQLESQRRQLDALLELLASATLPHESAGQAEPIADLNLDALLRRWQLDDRNARLYLSSTLASNRIREDIERYNQVLLLRRKLLELKPEFAAELSRGVETTADVRRQQRALQLEDRRQVMLIRSGRGLDSQGAVLKKTLEEALLKRRSQVDRYLGQARFSLARLYDQPPPGKAVRLEEIPPEPEEPGIFSLQRWIGDSRTDTSDQGNALTGEAPTGKTFADHEKRNIFDIRNWFRDGDRSEPLDEAEAPDDEAQQ